MLLYSTYYRGTIFSLMILLWYYIPLDIVHSNLGVRVFANGPGDLGSIPGRVIPKTQKMVLDASLLNTQHYKVRIKGKVEQSREGVAPSPTPWCSSYRKGSFRVTLDYGRQLYLLTISHILLWYYIFTVRLTDLNWLLLIYHLHDVPLELISLTLSHLYCPSFPTGLSGYILYQYRAVVDRF